MKNIGKLVVKALFVIVLFIGTTIALSGAGVNTISEAKAAVSYQQVYQYLVSQGYQVVALKAIQGTENWMAHTVRDGVHYQTTVYVEGDRIIVCTDVPM